MSCRLISLCCVVCSIRRLKTLLLQSRLGAFPRYQQSPGLRESDPDVLHSRLFFIPSGWRFFNKVSDIFILFSQHQLPRRKIKHRTVVCLPRTTSQRNHDRGKELFVKAATITRQSQALTPSPLFVVQRYGRLRFNSSRRGSRLSTAIPNKYVFVSFETLRLL